MKQKRAYRRLSSKERDEMFRLWRRGYEYAEIARMFGTYKQKPRSVVLRFGPTMEDYLCHDHFKRRRQFGSSGSSLGQDI